MERRTDASTYMSAGRPATTTIHSGTAVHNSTPSATSVPVRMAVGSARHGLVLPTASPTSVTPAVQFARPVTHHHNNNSSTHSGGFGGANGNLRTHHHRSAAPRVSPKRERLSIRHPPATVQHIRAANNGSFSMRFASTAPQQQLRREGVVSSPPLSATVTVVEAHPPPSAPQNRNIHNQNTNNTATSSSDNVAETPSLSFDTQHNSNSNNNNNNNNNNPSSSLGAAGGATELLTATPDLLTVSGYEGRERSGSSSTVLSMPLFPSCSATSLTLATATEGNRNNNTNSHNNNHHDHGDNNNVHRVDSSTPRQSSSILQEELPAAARPLNVHWNPVTVQGWAPALQQSQNQYLHPLHQQQQLNSDVSTGNISAAEAESAQNNHNSSIIQSSLGSETVLKTLVRGMALGCQLPGSKAAAASGRRSRHAERASALLSPYLRVKTRQRRRSSKLAKASAKNNNSGTTTNNNTAGTKPDGTQQVPDDSSVTGCCSLSATDPRRWVSMSESAQAPGRNFIATADGDFAEEASLTLLQQASVCQNGNANEASGEGTVAESSTASSSALSHVRAAGDHQSLVWAPPTTALDVDAQHGGASFLMETGEAPPEPFLSSAADTIGSESPFHRFTPIRGNNNSLRARQLLEFRRRSDTLRRLSSGTTTTEGSGSAAGGLYAASSIAESLMQMQFMPDAMQTAVFLHNTVPMPRLRRGSGGEQSAGSVRSAAWAQADLLRGKKGNGNNSNKNNNNNSDPVNNARGSLEMHPDPGEGSDDSWESDNSNNNKNNRNNNVHRERSNAADDAAMQPVAPLFELSGPYSDASPSTSITSSDGDHNNNNLYSSNRRPDRGLSKFFGGSSISSMGGGGQQQQQHCHNPLAASDGSGLPERYTVGSQQRRPSSTDTTTPKNNNNTNNNNNNNNNCNYGPLLVPGEIRSPSRNSPYPATSEMASSVAARSCRTIRPLSSTGGVIHNLPTPLTVPRFVRPVDVEELLDAAEYRMRHTAPPIVTMLGHTMFSEDDEHSHHECASMGTTSSLTSYGSGMDN